MADDSVQTFASHRRYLVPWHFIAMPIIGTHVIILTIELFGAPSVWAAWNLLVMAAVFTGFMCARWMSRQVQDRIIRLEEALRLERLLPGRGADIERLTIRQMIGLRFASDAEVPHLIDRVLGGELASEDDVKRAVQHWRADHLRV
jgi:hypothetical protein